MPISPDKKARLVIADLYPSEYIPKARCVLYSEDISPEEALSLGRKAMEELPDYMRGRAFIEDITAPATVELICDSCNTRRLPYAVNYLKSLLGL